MVSNCPACGAPLNVESSTKQTVCPFCGSNFKVDMGGVQPALEKTEAAAAQIKPPSANADLPAYTPPSSEPMQIDTDPLYNPPIESSPRPQPSTATSSPHIPFPRQTYESARQTAQTMYGNLAQKGKSFLVGGLILMLALIGGCCFCLVLAIRQIFGGG